VPGAMSASVARSGSSRSIGTPHSLRIRRSAWRAAHNHARPVRSTGFPVNLRMGRKAVRWPSSHRPPLSWMVSGG